MIYYLSKFLQALGMVIVFFAFFLKFPEVMSYSTFFCGIIVFLCGWLLGKFLLKK